MQVVQGYGLTETSPVVSVEMYAKNHFKLGSVGKVIDNVEVKIADDGEILVKGLFLYIRKSSHPTGLILLKDFYYNNLTLYYFILFTFFHAPAAGTTHNIFSDFLKC